jgi:hypothetical protein
MHLKRFARIYNTPLLTSETPDNLPRRAAAQRKGKRGALILLFLALPLILLSIIACAPR